MPINVDFSPIQLVGTAEGRFGELSVCDAEGTRSLWCDMLCHGSAYLEPAAVVDGETFTPGAIPEASYLLGWLVAALPRVDGDVLMAGLGAGAGVTTLLHEFPHLQITVAEIDPEVTILACKHFPLLRRYQRDGRLTIVTDDIGHLVRSARGARWSAALLDAYQQNSIVYCPKALLAGLRECADAVWINVVDDERTPRVCRCVEDLAAVGWAPRTVIPIMSVHQEVEYLSGNYLIGTDEVDLNAAARFVPFAGIDHPHADLARSSYRASLQRIGTWRPPVVTEAMVQIEVPPAVA